MIHALHGFLGLPRDWDIFESAAQDHRGRQVRLVKHNLWEELAALEDKSLTGWAQKINEEVEARREMNDEKPHLLLGYSMGGRLAMHALLQNPQNWSGAILVSAHPGLTSKEDRDARSKNDEKWADRWRSEKWSDAWRAWQALPVFNTTTQPAIVTERTEREFDRNLLAEGMMAWSLSRQEDLLEKLFKLKKPVLWLAGDEDTKFKAIHMDVAKRAGREGRTLHKFGVIKGAGHRLPWDQPEMFLNSIQDFIGANSL